ncbi:hypothetical protein C7Y69_09415 [Alteromonas sp. KS69]|uniref:transposase n=1 Tax=Alteromonas sp. KS69 TaxID=2109917 RepID=UPI000F86EB5D|nr:transposase [Alteromonas sp. KS69]RUP81353.1 hypothetical protein C7Y69_09415 [Alteromonas sp. KS69]|tara:strand:+ start:26397 stop:28604 length:2208 start_codon:yes stop_codon:yes gene_type:complete
MAAIKDKNKVSVSTFDISRIADIPVNCLLTNGDKRYTVVKIFTGLNELALSLHKTKPNQPFIIRFGSAIQGCAWENFNFELNNFNKRKVVEKASDNAWERAQARYNAILPIVGSLEQNIESKLELYIRGVPLTKDLEACAERSGCTVQSIYNWLNLYLAFGSHLTALLPSHYNSGVGRPLPASFMVAANKSLGNESISPYFIRRVFNQEDQDRLDKFIKSDLRGQPDYKMTSLHSVFINNYCKDTAPAVLQYVAQKYVNLSKYVSYDQFSYHFIKTVDPMYFKECSKGVKKAHNDDAPRIGVAQDLTIGPTYLYEIDSTTLNVYVVTRVPDKGTGVLKTKRLGRPYLYFVVDVYSGKIVGFSVTFKRNAMAAKSALFNAFTDKVTFCARYGIDIDKSEWACEHICLYLFSDRGADYTRSIFSDALAADLGMEGISYAPAYLSRSRGTVEVSFDSTDGIVIQRVDGSVDPKRAKDSVHPSTTSEINIEDLNRLIIEAILVSNRNKINCTRLHSSDVFKGINATPNAIWAQHIDTNMGGGITKPVEEVKYALLNQGQAKVFKDYIELDTNTVKVRFRTKDAVFAKRQAKLRSKKASFIIKMRYNPDDFRFAWYADPDQDFTIIEFNLASEHKRFDELTEIEIYQLDRVEAAQQSLNGQNRDFEHVHITEKIEEVNTKNRAKGSKSKGKKSMAKGIDENSKIEAKVETILETNYTRTLFGFDCNELGARTSSEGGSDE